MNVYVNCVGCNTERQTSAYTGTARMGTGTKKEVLAYQADFLPYFKSL